MEEFRLLQEAGFNRGLLSYLTSLPSLPAQIGSPLPAIHFPFTLHVHYVNEKYAC